MSLHGTQCVAARVTTSVMSLQGVQVVAARVECCNTSPHRLQLTCCKGMRVVPYCCMGGYKVLWPWLRVVTHSCIGYKVLWQGLRVIRHCCKGCNMSVSVDMIHIHGAMIHGKSVPVDP